MALPELRPSGVETLGQVVEALTNRQGLRPARGPSDAARLLGGAVVQDSLGEPFGQRGHGIDAVHLVEQEMKELQDHQGPNSEEFDTDSDGEDFVAAAARRLAEGAESHLRKSRSLPMSS